MSDLTFREYLATSQMTIEERLQRLESKLEMLREKVDTIAVQVGELQAKVSGL